MPMAFTAGLRRASLREMADLYGAYHLIECSGDEAAATRQQVTEACRRALADPSVHTWSWGEIEGCGDLLVIVSATEPAALGHGIPTARATRHFTMSPLEDPLKGNLADPAFPNLPPSTRLHVARLPILAGQRDRALDTIASELRETHAETGVHRFSLHPEVGTPDALIVVEAWRARTDWEAHMAAPYCRAVMDRLARLLDGDMEVHIAQMCIGEGASKSI